VSDNVSSFLGSKLVEELVDKVNDVSELSLINRGRNLIGELSQDADDGFNEGRLFVGEVLLEESNHIGELSLGLDET